MAGLVFDPKMTGKRIADLRKERGWTQNKLALKLTVDQTVMSHIEHGYRVTIDNIVEFAKIFEVSSDYILGISDSRVSCNIDNTDLMILEQISFFSKDEKIRLLKHLELENSLNSRTDK